MDAAIPSPATPSPVPCPSRSLDALAVAARDGVRGADALLIEALMEKLRPLIAFRISACGRDSRAALVRADIDDVLQDLILLLWQNDLARFDASKAGFLTYANRRLRWHLADRARVARRDRGEECDDVELEAVVDAGRDPESLLASHREEVMMRDMEKTVARAIAGDSDATEVVVRCDLQGARLREVAAELGIHVSNACRARKRGLRQLARHLEALV